MIKWWLATTIANEIRSAVKYVQTIKEILNDHEERFGKESASRAYKLKQSLTITLQNGMSTSTYYTKLRGLWDEIQIVSPSPWCTCTGCT